MQSSEDEANHRQCDDDQADDVEDIVHLDLQIAYTSTTRHRVNWFPLDPAIVALQIRV